MIPKPPAQGATQQPEASGSASTATGSSSTATTATPDHPSFTKQLSCGKTMEEIISDIESSLYYLRRLSLLRRHLEQSTTQSKDEFTQFDLPSPDEFTEFDLTISDEFIQFDLTSSIDELEKLLGELRQPQKNNTAKIVAIDHVLKNREKRVLLSPLGYTAQPDYLTNIAFETIASAINDDYIPLSTTKVQKSNRGLLSRLMPSVIISGVYLPTKNASEPKDLPPYDTFFFSDELIRQLRAGQEIACGEVICPAYYLEPSMQAAFYVINYGAIHAQLFSYISSAEEITLSRSLSATELSQFRSFYASSNNDELKNYFGALDEHVERKLLALTPSKQLRALHDYIKKPPLSSPFSINEVIRQWSTHFSLYLEIAVKKGVLTAAQKTSILNCRRTTTKVDDDTYAALKQADQLDYCFASLGDTLASLEGEIKVGDLLEELAEIINNPKNNAYLNFPPMVIGNKPATPPRPPSIQPLPRGQQTITDYSVPYLIQRAAKCEDAIDLLNMLKAHDVPNYTNIIMGYLEAKPTEQVEVLFDTLLAALFPSTTTRAEMTRLAQVKQQLLFVIKKLKLNVSKDYIFAANHSIYQTNPALCQFTSFEQLRDFATVQLSLKGEALQRFYGNFIPQLSDFVTTRGALKFLQEIALTPIQLISFCKELQKRNPPFIRSLAEIEVITAHRKEADRAFIYLAYADALEPLVNEGAELWLLRNFTFDAALIQKHNLSHYLPSDRFELDKAATPAPSYQMMPEYIVTLFSNYINAHPNDAILKQMPANIFAVPKQSDAAYIGCCMARAQEIIKSTTNLADLHSRYLSSGTSFNNLITIFEIIAVDKPELINTKEKWQAATKTFTKEQTTALYMACFKVNPNIFIFNWDDVTAINFAELSVERVAFIFKTLAANKPKILPKGLKGYTSLLKTPDTQRMSAILAPFKLPDLLNDVADFIALQFVGLDDETIVGHLQSTKGKKAITRLSEVFEVANAYPAPLAAKVLVVHEPSSFILSLDDLRAARALTSDNIVTVYRSVRQTNPRLLSTLTAWIHATQPYAPATIALLRATYLEPNPDEFIKTYDDLLSLHHLSLTPTALAAIINRFITLIPNMQAMDKLIMSFPPASVEKIREQVDITALISAQLKSGPEMAKIFSSLFTALQKAKLDYETASKQPISGDENQQLVAFVVLEETKMTLTEADKLRDDLVKASTDFERMTLIKEFFAIRDRRATRSPAGYTAQPRSIANALCRKIADSINDQGIDITDKGVIKIAKSNQRMYELLMPSLVITGVYNALTEDDGSDDPPPFDEVALSEDLLLGAPDRTGKRTPDKEGKTKGQLIPVKSLLTDNHILTLFRLLFHCNDEQLKKIAESLQLKITDKTLAKLIKLSRSLSASEVSRIQYYYNRAITREEMNILMGLSPSSNLSITLANKLTALNSKIPPQILTEEEFKTLLGVQDLTTEQQDRLVAFNLPRYFQSLSTIYDTVRLPKVSVWVRLETLREGLRKGGDSNRAERDRTNPEEIKRLEQVGSGGNATAGFVATLEISEFLEWWNAMPTALRAEIELLRLSNDSQALFSTFLDNLRANRVTDGPCIEGTRASIGTVMTTNRHYTLQFNNSILENCYPFGKPSSANTAYNQLEKRKTALSENTSLQGQDYITAIPEELLIAVAKTKYASNVDLFRFLKPLDINFRGVVIRHYLQQQPGPLHLDGWVSPMITAVCPQWSSTTAPHEEKYNIAKFFALLLIIIKEVKPNSSFIKSTEYRNYRQYIINVNPAAFTFNSMRQFMQLMEEIYPVDISEHYIFAKHFIGRLSILFKHPDDCKHIKYFAQNEKQVHQLFVYLRDKAILTSMSDLTAAIDSINNSFRQHAYIYFADRKANLITKPEDLALLVKFIIPGRSFIRQFENFESGLLNLLLTDNDPAPVVKLFTQHSGLVNTFDKFVIATQNYPHAWRNAVLSLWLANEKNVASLTRDTLRNLPATLTMDDMLAIFAAVNEQDVKKADPTTRVLRDGADMFFVTENYSVDKCKAAYNKICLNKPEDFIQIYDDLLRLHNLSLSPDTVAAIITKFIRLVHNIEAMDRLLLTFPTAHVIVIREKVDTAEIIRARLNSSTEMAKIISSLYLVLTRAKQDYEVANKQQIPSEENKLQLTVITLEETRITLDEASKLRDDLLSARNDFERMKLIKQFFAARDLRVTRSPVGYTAQPQSIANELCRKIADSINDQGVDITEKAVIKITKSNRRLYALLMPSLEITGVHDTLQDNSNDDLPAFSEVTLSDDLLSTPKAGKTKGQLIQVEKDPASSTNTSLQSQNTITAFPADLLIAVARPKYATNDLLFNFLKNLDIASRGIVIRNYLQQVNSTFDLTSWVIRMIDVVCVEYYTKDTHYYNTYYHNQTPVATKFKIANFLALLLAIIKEVKPDSPFLKGSNYLQYREYIVKHNPAAFTFSSMQQFMQLMDELYPATKKQERYTFASVFIDRLPILFQEEADCVHIQYFTQNETQVHKVFVHLRDTGRFTSLSALTRTIDRVIFSDANHYQASTNTLRQQAYIYFADRIGSHLIKTAEDLALLVKFLISPYSFRSQFKSQFKSFEPDLLDLLLTENNPAPVVKLFTQHIGLLNTFDQFLTTTKSYPSEWRNAVLKLWLANERNVALFTRNTLQSLPSTLSTDDIAAIFAAVNEQDAKKTESKTRVLRDFGDLIPIAQNYTIEKRKLVYKICLNRLADLVSSTAHLENFKNDLISADDMMRFLKQLLDTKPRLIVGRKNWGLIANQWGQNQDKTLLRDFRDRDTFRKLYIAKLLRDAETIITTTDELDHLSDLGSDISTDNISAIFRKIASKIPPIISKMSDLENATRSYPVEKREAAYFEFVDLLIATFKKPADAANYKNLSPHRIKQLFLRIRERDQALEPTKRVIKDWNDLQQAGDSLRTASTQPTSYSYRNGHYYNPIDADNLNRQAVYLAYESDLSAFIKTPSDIEHVKYLDANSQLTNLLQKDTIAKLLAKILQDKTKAPHFIGRANWGKICSFLNTFQCTTAKEVYLAHHAAADGATPSTLDDLAYLATFQIITEAQVTSIFTKVRDKKPPIITSYDELQTAAKGLSSTNREHAYDVFDAYFVDKVKNAGHCGLLQSLEINRLRRLVKMIKDRDALVPESNASSRVINGFADLNTVSTAVTPGNSRPTDALLRKHVIYLVYQDKLADYMTTATDFAELKYLDPQAQITRVDSGVILDCFKAILATKPHLLIGKSRWQNATRHLEEYRTAYKAVENYYVLQLAERGDTLITALPPLAELADFALSTTQLTTIFTKVKNKQPSLIMSMSDLNTATIGYSIHQKAAAFAAFTDNELIAMINTIDNCKVICNLTDTERLNRLFVRLLAEKPQLFPNKTSWEQVFSTIPSTQRQNVLLACLLANPSVILYSLEDIRGLPTYFTSPLSTPEIGAIFLKLQQRKPPLIDSLDDLATATANYSLDQSKAAYEAFVTQLPDFIRGNKGYRGLQAFSCLRKLTPAAITRVCSDIKEKDAKDSVPVIRNWAALATLAQGLDNNQKATLYRVYIDVLPDFITEPGECSHLSVLTEQEIDAVFSRIKAKSPPVICSVQNLQAATTGYLENSKNRVYTLFADCAADFIVNFSDFNDLSLFNLDDTAIAGFFAHDNVHRFFQSVAELVSITPHLRDEAQTRICYRSVFSKRAIAVNTKEHVQLCLQFLAGNQLYLTLHRVGHKLASFFNKAEDIPTILASPQFTLVMAQLINTKFVTIYEALRYAEPGFDVFKTDFIGDIRKTNGLLPQYNPNAELVKLVLTHMDNSDSRRTAQAWKILGETADLSARDLFGRVYDTVKTAQSSGLHFLWGGGNVGSPDFDSVNANSALAHQQVKAILLRMGK